MRAGFLKLMAVSAVVVATTGLVAAPAEAAPAYYFYGYAGGSMIRAADSTITSALSAESEVFTTKTGVQDANALAAFRAQGVLSLGAISTSAKTTTIPGGQQVSVSARSADVNLLNGLITASAVSTTTTTKRVNGVLTSATHSTFTGLHVEGFNLPVDIPQNYALKIGDVASVLINAAAVAADQGVGVGLRVTLLQPEGSADAGAQIDVNPTLTAVASNGTSLTGHTTVGNAYATRIKAPAGKTVTVRSDPTVPTTVFAQGTNGATLTNSVASLNLSPVATCGAVQTTGVATNTTTVASVTMTASVANLSLLSGVITAQALKVTAHAGLSKLSGSLALAGLHVGGTTVPLSVAPNTVITLDIGKVIVNQRIRSSHSIVVRAIDIVLSKAANGLPAGTEIQVAVATAGVS